MWRTEWNLCDMKANLFTCQCQLPFWGFFFFSKIIWSEKNFYIYFFRLSFFYFSPWNVLGAREINVVSLRSTVVAFAVVSGGGCHWQRKTFPFPTYTFVLCCCCWTKHDDEGFVAAWQVSWGWSEKVECRNGRRRILKFQIMLPAERLVDTTLINKKLDTFLR